MRLPSPLRSPDDPAGGLTLSNAGVPGATPTPAAPAAATPATPAVPATPAAADPGSPSLVSATPGAAATPATPATPVTPAVAATWPDDWRVKAAAGDEKAAALLGRYADPTAFVKAHLALQQKLSSGDLKPSLPADATPEQVTEYRKLHGIPETADGYLKDLPSGIVVGEEDKVLFGDFAKNMHEINAPPQFVHKALDWYYKFQEGIAREDEVAAQAFYRTAEDSLRSLWGNEFRENVDRGGEVLGMAPERIRNVLETAMLPPQTLADGTKLPARKLGVDPDVAQWLVSISRELNPVRTIVPSGGNPAAALGEEIKALEAKMADRSSDYWKGPSAEANQARYRDLIDARDRQKARAA